jgi:transposase InsO family protein
MISRYIVRNCQQDLQFLKPIDADPTWRNRIKALLIATPLPLCEGEVIAQLEQEDGRPAPNNAIEAFRAVRAAARAAGRLRFEDASPATAATKISLIADDEPVGPSFIRDLIGGQHTPAPMYASPRTSTASIAQPMITTLSDEDKKEWNTRVAVARAKLTHPKLTWADLAARFEITKRRARYYCKEYARGQENELRPGQRNSSGLRVDPEIIRTIDKRWKHARTRTRRQIYEDPELRAVITKVRAAGGRASLSYQQLARYVRVVLKPNKIYEAMRTGKKRLPSPASFGPVNADTLITELLREVQVDHTPIDCILLSSDGTRVLVRGFVMYAIDVASRCLWAWRVCLTRPTEFDYLQLIQMGIRPKDELVKALGAQPYPVHGLPWLTLADRGWEFGAQRSRERVNEVGITVEHAAPRRPEMKGLVERVIGTMNTRWIHRLPGTTKGSVQELGDRDPEKEALERGLNIDQFERFLSLMIIEGYSNQLHTEIGKTPLEMWAHLAQKNGAARSWPTDAASQARLDLLGLLDTGEVRVRSTVGYEFANATFRSLRRDAPKKARLMIDPDDVRSIETVDADEASPTYGMSGGPATIRDLPHDAPIPLALLPALLAQNGGPIGVRNGAERITDLLAQVEPSQGRTKGTKTRSKKESKRDATKAEKAIRAARRNARGHAVPTSSPAATSVADESDEPLLEPLEESAA